MPAPNSRKMNRPEANSASQLARSASNKMSQCIKLMRASGNLHRPLSLVVLVGLVGLLQLQPARADQAISEVWSEGDGLRMKYSTNHNDLLSTKGSELSLSTDQREQQVADPSKAATDQAAGGESGESGEAAGSSGGPEDSTSSSAAAVEGSDEQQESPSSDQNEADSSSRRTEKIPLAGRVSSYSTDGSSLRLRGQAASAAADSLDQAAIPSPSSQQQQRSSKMGGRASFKPADPELSFDSALEQSGGGIGGVGGDPDSAADRGQDESAESATDGRDHSASLSAKFRAPSRAFKEAVRMKATSSSAEDGDRENSDDESNGNGNGKESSSSNNGDDSKSANKNDNDDDDSSSGNSDSEPTPTRSGGGGGKQKEFRRPPVAQQRQPTPGALDFERPNAIASLDEDDDDDDSNSEFKRASGGPARQLGGLAHFGPAIDSDEYFGPVQRPQQAHFHDHSGHMRAPMATAHKERQVPQQHQQASAAGAKQPASGRNYLGAAVQQQPKQQLAYLRGVSSPSAAAAAASPGRQQHLSSRPGGFGSELEHERQGHVSPDSVRDNFISPGHFPGSMPHLTQAASEIRARDEAARAAAASTATTTVADSAPEASEAKATTGVSSEPASGKSAAGGGAAAAGDGGGASQEAKESSQLVASDTINTINFNDMSAGPAAGAAPLAAPADLATTAASHTTTTTTTTSTTSTTPAARGGPETHEANEIIVAQMMVTPQPEVQFEGQDQIMAPILVSTTTMAPALSTSTSAAPSAATRSSDNGTTAASSASTTSQAPSLKRFKFRKYR